MVRHVPRIVPALVGAMVLSAWLLVGCSGSAEDMRVRFCKQLVLAQVQTPGEVRWISVATDPRGYAGLFVTLKFEDGGGAGWMPRQRQAICEYRYQVSDDTALQLSDPLSAYATAPESMSMDGTPLSRAVLSKAIQDSMILQGKALIDRAKQGINEAAETARARLDSER
ncbi:hypothetical protein CKO25_17525 [Thiocapsa imhoffii]|uniref:Uncharacterized protein n=2 Tax=Thiocapsa imhoffii TaxID=382777 RepID=A0A9X1BAQ6_9GAMM|nr:hypothetical protein [Thiocapsa imhoffii]